MEAQELNKRKVNQKWKAIFTSTQGDSPFPIGESYTLVTIAIIKPTFLCSSSLQLGDLDVCITTRITGF